MNQISSDQVDSNTLRYMMLCVHCESSLMAAADTLMPSKLLLLENANIADHGRIRVQGGKCLRSPGFVPVPWIYVRGTGAKSSLLNGTRLEGRRKNETVFIPELQNKSPVAFTKLNLGDATAAEEEEKDSEGDVK